MPLTEPQRKIAEAEQRFRVVIAGRRFGKTHLACRELAYYARIPDQTVWYVAPTYRQAKMITWKKLRNKLMDLNWVKKVNESELTIELKNGSTISLKGADSYDSLRGAGIHFLCLDEFADIDPAAWYETLRPTLSDTGGRALFIGTPKGMNWAKDLYDLAEEFPDEWASFTFTTVEGGQVPQSEIDAARRTLDERIFRQEFLASWETFTGRIFYAFERTQNIQAYSGAAPRELHIGCDFNLDPISAVIGVKQGTVFHIIDEIRMMGSNTDELVEEIRNRYPNQTIICYPDPAGAARKTSAAGRTDHTILRNAGFTVKAPHAHKPVRDGINAVNAKLRNSEGISTLFIDPKCKYIIECLEKHTYKEGTNIPDKDSGFDHMTDALRYAIDWLYPITQPTQAPAVRTWGHKVSNRQGFTL